MYFGGGTPTTLSAQDLGRIFSTIEQNFDLSHLMEYTVEAGRPDTVTQERLEVIHAAGVQRISINPQSFNRRAAGGRSAVFSAQYSNGAGLAGRVHHRAHLGSENLCLYGYKRADL